MTQVKGRIAVVGVDFGNAGDDAIVEALALLASGLLARVHVVHVLDPRDVVDDPEKPALATEEEVLERAPTILRERVDQVGCAVGISVDMSAVMTHARIGKAADTLLQVAVDYDADLIVVGTHGRRGFDRVLLGSVAETLVRKAKCPVLVARPKDYGHTKKTPLPEPPYAPGEEPNYSEPKDVAEHISTQEVRWGSERPTGFRIV